MGNRKVMDKFDMQNLTEIPLYQIRKILSQTTSMSDFENENRATNSDIIGSRKRVPQVQKISEQQINRMIVGLNQEAPSQLFINLIDSEQVQTIINEYVDQLLESSVKPVFSPCGNYYASFNNGSVQVRNAGKLMMGLIIKIELRQKAYKGFSAIPITTTIRFSPDSSFFAVLKGKILLIYSIQGKLRMRISDQFIQERRQKLDIEKPFRRDIRDFFWSQNSTLPQIIVQFTKTEFYRVYTIDCESVQQINYVVIDEMHKNHAFSTTPGPNLFAVVSKPTQKKQKCMQICLYLTNHMRWKFIGYQEIPVVYIDKIQFSPDKQFLILFPASELKVQLYSLLTKQFTTLIEDHCMMLSWYKMSNTGSYLAIGTNSGTIFVFVTLTWTKRFQFQLEPKVHLDYNFIVLNQQNDRFKVQKEGIFKLPYNNPNEGFVTVLNSIIKIQFSLNEQFLAVKSAQMPHSIFIYSLNESRTIIINTINKVSDFKWLQVKQGPQTLCIAFKQNGVVLWKNTRHEGQLFFQVIPQNKSGQTKITDIEVGKNGDLILYAKEQKKFVYCRFNGSLPKPQQEKDIEI